MGNVETPISVCESTHGGGSDQRATPPSWGISQTMQMSPSARDAKSRSMPPRTQPQPSTKNSTAHDQHITDHRRTHRTPSADRDRLAFTRPTHRPGLRCGWMEPDGTRTIVSTEAKGLAGRCGRNDFPAARILRSRKSRTGRKIGKK